MSENSEYQRHLHRRSSFTCKMSESGIVLENEFTLVDPSGTPYAILHVCQVLPWIFRQDIPLTR